jgi:hypothetical protein
MNLKVWLASLLLAFTPAVAGAVTLTLGPETGGTPANAAIATVTYTNDAIGKAVKIVGFTITGQSTGSAPVADLTASTYQVTSTAFSTGPSAFPVSLSGPGFAAGFVPLPAFIVTVGDSFTLDFVFAPALDPTTSASWSFTVAPVPLPAAGWMLVSAIAGVGFLARRRSQVA